ncbi:carboxymuconolactone decarboxylase family protein [Bacteriovorax sp. Seq25_V]|uniref:carboxymuconolactone decarboxylase family protein n=1 Tax=Bacteriovorax sp. Seq25_V TaxID=1201288 RepID=UPI00038A25C3|nr:carboxymuconolactone decarboxylase family protein [Bacteriovorax sp. Seq25_V]EQC45380.1 carboxymuconolactone decarboxylase family protein [Bacteriovorax sp. Seq25_V]
MSRVKLVEPTSINGEHGEVLKSIKGAFGTVPNMFKAIGNSHAGLESMWTSFGALGKGTIGSKLGEQIAVYVADLNRCEYCLAAHTVLGKNAGASAEEMSEAQRGKAQDSKTQAALVFTKKLVLNRGAVEDSDVEAVRDAGFNDSEITEILAHVALNIFTNYTNVAFNVPVDFPKVSLT